MDNLMLYLILCLVCTTQTLTVRALVRPLKSDEDYTDLELREIEREERDRVMAHLPNDHDTLRPIPSELLPVPLLHIPTTEDRPLPRRSDLKKRKLRGIMGDLFNRKFVSVREPKEHIQHPNGVDVFNPNAAKLHWDTFKDLKFNVRRGKNSVRIRSKRNRKMLRKFLAQYTSCPVRYQWRKLDAYHWPPWVKVGLCDPNRPCSLPRGMGCHAHQFTNVTLLLWNCRDSACTWLPYNYPVVTSCKCDCD